MVKKINCEHLKNIPSNLSIKEFFGGAYDSDLTFSRASRIVNFVSF